MRTKTIVDKLVENRPVYDINRRELQNIVRQLAKQCVVKFMAKGGGTFSEFRAFVKAESLEPSFYALRDMANEIDGSGRLAQMCVLDVITAGVNLLKTRWKPEHDINL